MEWRRSMQSLSRKLLTIITEAVIEKDLIAAIERLGASGYTITDARGKGHRGARNAGWELDANIRIEVVCEESLAQAIAARLKEHFYKNFAMILFVSNVDLLTYSNGNK